MGKLSICLLSVFIISLCCCSRNPQGESILVDVSALPSVQLMLVDSIGEEMGDSNYVMGSIEGIEFGPDGDIAVLDCGRSCVRLYSPGGTFRRQISSRGNGPGELQNPTFMAISESGTVYVSGAGGEVFGVHAYDYISGEWLGTQSTFVPPSCLEGAEADFYIRKTIEFEMRGQDPFLMISVAKYDFSCDEPSLVLLEESRALDLSDEAGLLELDWYGFDIAADHDGRVHIAPRSTEEAVVISFDSTGREFQRLHLDLEPTLRTEEEMEMERNILRAKAVASNENPHGLEPDPFKPLIRGLNVDVEGNLWVLQGGPSIPTFSIFDSMGVFKYNAVVQGCPVDGSSWRFHMDEHGILAYAEDPSSGFQKVYLLK